MDETGIKEKEDYLEKNNPFCNDEIILNFSLKNCQKDYYYKIKLYNHGKTLGNFTEFETEAMLCDKDNSEINFSKNLVCNYYFYKKQTIIISINKGILIKPSILYMKYDRFTVLSSLMTSPNAIYERELKEKDPQSEKFIIKLEKKAEKNRLFDYIKSGIGLSCHISLDFTKEDNRYLKFDNSENDIDYGNIIENLKNIISNYIPNRLFHVYAIEGMSSYGQNSKKVFDIKMNLNNLNKSCKKLYDNIIEEYHNSVNEINPDNKVYFSPIINKVNEDIFDGNKFNYYNTLFILTKDNIDKNDIQKTYSSIIRSSYLPVSIVIIGVGKNNFDKMKKIFSSESIFSRPKRTKEFRNNLIFVPSYYQNLNNPQKITEWCLNKIEQQALNYYNLIKCKPEKIQSNDYDIIKNSFSVFKSIANNEEIEEVDENDSSENPDDIKEEEEEEPEKNTVYSINGEMPLNNISENIFPKMSFNINNSIKNNDNDNDNYLKDDNINIDNNKIKNSGFDQYNISKESVKINDEQKNNNLELNNNNNYNDIELNNYKEDSKDSNNKNEIKLINDNNCNNNDNNIKNEEIKRGLTFNNNNNYGNNKNSITRQKSLPQNSIIQNFIDNPYINDIKKNKEEELKSMDIKQSSIFGFDKNDENDPDSKDYINQNLESNDNTNKIAASKMNNYISGFSGLKSTKNTECIQLSNNLFN